MLNPLENRGLAAGLPLTHSVYIAECASTKTKHGGQHRPWVQVRKRDPGGHAVLCGQVLEIEAGTADEWFKVDTAIGTMWATSRNVRMCSGDGRCTCEPEDPPPKLPLPSALCVAALGGGSSVNQHQTNDTINQQANRLITQHPCGFAVHQEE